MTAPVMLGALAAGIAFGYASQRGAFCMSSGMRAVLEGEWTKMKALRPRRRSPARAASGRVRVGASAADAGPLRGVRAALQEAMPAVSWSPPLAVSVGAGLLLLGALFRSADGRAGAWSWRRTGLWVGIVAAIAWPVSGRA
jgi:hypothetical protein